jgi:hypothetical protein
MPRIHEMPTHLNVEDTLLGPLTPSQLLRLAMGLSLAYTAWDQLTILPDPVRAGLAGVLALFGVLVACCRPGGVGLDSWALAALAYGMGPRQLVWTRHELPTNQRETRAPDWAELEVEFGWHRRETNALRPLADWQPGLRS